MMITTDRQIQSLKPGERVYWQSVRSPHGGGLAIRVSTRGTRSWYVRYRHDGRQDAICIGHYPGMKLQAARDRHYEIRQLVADNLDPKRIQRQQKAANLEAWSMDQLFDRWVAHYAATPTVRTKRPPSAMVVEQTRWRWSHYLAGRLGDFLVKSIERSHLSNAIAETASEKSREQARKCLSLLKAMLEYAEARGQIEDNPATGIQPSKVGALPARPRERHLDLEELRRLWAAIDQARLATSTAAALKLLILTGQRRGELLQARWADIDLEKGVWALPAHTTKSHKAHTVYLSAPAIGLLRSLDRHREYVFPGRVESQPIGAQSLTTATLRLQGRKTKERDLEAPLGDMNPFSVHDLRRSVATGLGEYCAVQPHVIERMLNHANENRLVDTYQRSTYEAEQRAAWQAWGELIDNQVARTRQNVVPMRRATE